MNSTATPIYGPQVEAFIAQHLHADPFGDLAGFDLAEASHRVDIRCAAMTTDELLAAIDQHMNSALASALEIGAVVAKAWRNGGPPLDAEWKRIATRGYVELLVLCLRTPPQYWRALQQLPAEPLRQMVEWSTADIVRFCAGEHVQGQTYEEAIESGWGVAL